MVVAARAVAPAIHHNHLAEFLCTVSVRHPARLLSERQPEHLRIESSVVKFGRLLLAGRCGQLFWTWSSLMSLHRWWLEHASVREFSKVSRRSESGSSAVASVEQRDWESSVIAEEPGRIGAPPNKANAEDDELRFAPFLASDRQGRCATRSRFI